MTRPFLPPGTSARRWNRSAVRSREAMGWVTGRSLVVMAARGSRISRKQIARLLRIATPALHEAVESLKIHSLPASAKKVAVFMAASFVATTVATKWLQLVPSALARRTTAALIELDVAGRCFENS